MNSRKLLFLHLTILLISLSSCDSGSIVQDKFVVPEGEWHMNKRFVSKVEVTDLQNPYNFYLNIRNGGDYPYNNLHVFVTTTFPNGKKHIDTVNCLLADNAGRWYGSGLGDLIDNRVLFVRNSRFPLAGKYSFTIEHAMRDTIVPAIFNVGLSIEKTNS